MVAADSPLAVAGRRPALRRPARAADDRLPALRVRASASTAGCATGASRAGWCSAATTTARSRDWSARAWRRRWCRCSRPTRATSAVALLGDGGRRPGPPDRDRLAPRPRPLARRAGVHRAGARSSARSWSRPCSGRPWAGRGPGPAGSIAGDDRTGTAAEGLDCIVVGGGLAGLACAHGLVDGRALRAGARGRGGARRAGPHRLAPRPPRRPRLPGAVQRLPAHAGAAAGDRRCRAATSGRSAAGPSS